MTDMYAVLNSDKSATPEDIRRAYRKLATVHHPDKGGDPEKFKEISAAYEILSDPDKRRQYDNPQHDSLNDALNSMFGAFHGMSTGFNPNFVNGFGTNKKRRSVTHILSMTLADAYAGTSTTLRVILEKCCSHCEKTCPQCKGRGEITHTRQFGPFAQNMTEMCGACKGACNVSPGCAECKLGKINEEQLVTVVLPPGVATGYKSTHVGLGEQAMTPGDIPGDLIFEVFVAPDGLLKRVGDDLVYTVDISFADAVCGRDIEVPHFKNLVTVHTQDFGIVHPKARYTIHGKGMPPNGNLIIIFNVAYPPAKLSEDQRDALRNILETL